MPTKPLQFLAFALVTASLAGLVACGDDDDDTSAGSDATEADSTAPAAGSDTTAADTTIKPVIEAKTAEPPAELVITDLVAGAGAEAVLGSTVEVHYVGAHYATGEQFDASWDRGATFPLVLGAGRVIPGWEQGLVGMLVGGRRELIIPPALAYGAAGRPPVIQPDETLVFVIDLVSVS